MLREDIIYPGETLKELLETYNYTQKDLADKLQMDLKTVNEILNGKAPITADTAMKFEMIFGIDAIFWNNLEFNYRKKLKEFADQEKVEKESEKINEIYKEMVKRNLVESTKDKREKVQNFKKFMEITEIENIENEFLKVACRKQKTEAFSIINLMVWIQIGIKKARNIEVEEYSKEKVLNSIEEIRNFTLMENQVDARNQLVEICNRCGIVLNYEKSMQNTAIYGIAKWINPTTPFIQISDRRKNMSTFWFSFMHELGHIVNGRKTACFLDMDNNEVTGDDAQLLKDVEEMKADKFAKDKLVPEKEYKEFISSVKNRNLKREDIILFAKKIKINPCIVAGRIQYDLKSYGNKVLNSFSIKNEF